MASSQINAGCHTLSEFAALSNGVVSCATVACNFCVQQLHTKSRYNVGQIEWTLDALFMLDNYLDTLYIGYQCVYSHLQHRG